MLKNRRFNLWVGVLAGLLAARFAWLGLAENAHTGGIEQLTFDVLLVAGIAARVRLIYVIALAWEAYTAYAFARGGAQFYSTGLDASLIFALAAMQVAILGVLLARPLRAMLRTPRYRASITSAT
jgi:hypothetical protein